MAYSKIATLLRLLSMEGKRNEKTPLFKKTAVAFQKRHGIELAGAPMIVWIGGSVCKLSHLQYRTTKGRLCEDAVYLPMVEVGNRFKRLAL